MPVRDAPEVTEMEATFAAGKVNVNWIAAGSLPAEEVRTRPKATVPLAAAVPDDSERESGPICPKEARVNSSMATAIIVAMEPGVIYRLIASTTLIVLVYQYLRYIGTRK